MSFLLFYTFVVTPVQVAFLQETPVPIFVLNRLVDLALMCDMILIMFLAVEGETRTRRKFWILHLWTIRWRYLRALFITDFVSLGASVVEILEYSGVPVFAGHAAKMSRFARFFRLVRVVRMGRLALIMNSMRRALQHVFRQKEVGFITMELVKWSLEFFLMGHVLACVLGYTASVEESFGGNSWIKAVEANKGFSLDRYDDTGWLYLLSLYWAFAILTTVGYGDVVPVTHGEVVVVVFIMVCGGCAWTLLMASVCSVVGVIDAQQIASGLLKEALVGIYLDHDIKPPLQAKLWSFMEQNKKHEKMTEEQAILSHMSPFLQGQVAMATSHNIFKHVFFLRFPKSWREKQPFQSFNTHRHFLLLLRLAEVLTLHVIESCGWVVPPDLMGSVAVTQLETHVSASGEVRRGGVFRGELPERHCAPLTYLESGVCVLNQVRLAGHLWHQDLVLESPMLRDRQVARSITFCSIYVLHREPLFELLNTGGFESSRALVRYHTIGLALIRMTKKAAELTQKAADQDGTAMSFAEAVEKLSKDHQKSATIQEVAKSDSSVLAQILERIQSMEDRLARQEQLQEGPHCRA